MGLFAFNRARRLKQEREAANKKAASAKKRTAIKKAGDKE